MSQKHVLLDGCLIHVSMIQGIDLSELADSKIKVQALGRTFNCTGFNALLLVWAVSPTALEGVVRGAWPKHAWAVHNLIGHPLMQLLAFVGCTKLAIRVHDGTVPKPAAVAWEERLRKESARKSK